MIHIRHFQFDGEGGYSLSSLDDQYNTVIPTRAEFTTTKDTTTKTTKARNGSKKIEGEAMLTLIEERLKLESQLAGVSKLEQRLKEVRHELMLCNDSGGVLAEKRVDEGGKNSSTTTTNSSNDGSPAEMIA